MNISGNFLPNLLVTNPKNILPINPPTPISEAIQEASSIVILPDGNGVLSDVNRMMLGLAHPHVTP